jgi:outer membrane lipoprotein LolB
MTSLNMRLTWFFLIIGLGLSGCSQLAHKDPVQTTDWQLHKTQVQNITQWQILGKLGVKVPNDGSSANLQWHHAPQNYQIDLSGPFGSGKMTIISKDNQVSLTEAGSTPRIAPTAEELIRKTTGWNIPVAQLAYWVKGIPAPNAKVKDMAFNTEGLISEMEQLGWKITYGSYLSVATPSAPIALPNRIVAEFNDIRLTLVIREWNINPINTQAL